MAHRDEDVVAQELLVLIPLSEAGALGLEEPRVPRDREAEQDGLCVEAAELGNFELAALAAGL